MTALPGPALARLGVAGAGAAVAVVGALHVLAADTVDPLRRTISEYALGTYGWLFDAGVLGLAAGAALVLVAVLRAGLVRVASPATALYALGVVGLVLVVVFEKANWAIGPSLSGYVHRYAGLVAFVALPLGVLLVARRAGARWAGVLGGAALGWLAAILAGIPVGPLLGRSWWQVLPLGLMERGLAVTLVAAVVALGMSVSGSRPSGNPIAWLPSRTSD